MRNFSILQQQAVFSELFPNERFLTVLHAVELLNDFHHIEIMSDKQPSDYNKLLRHLDCQPENFLMLGNSLRSDVLPVLNIGAWAGYIPYHITWAH